MLQQLRLHHRPLWGHRGNGVAARMPVKTTHKHKPHTNTKTTHKQTTNKHAQKGQKPHTNTKTTHKQSNKQQTNTQKPHTNHTQTQTTHKHKNHTQTNNKQTHTHTNKQQTNTQKPHKNHTQHDTNTNHTQTQKPHTNKQQTNMTKKHDKMHACAQSHTQLKRGAAGSAATQPVSQSVRHCKSLHVIKGGAYGGAGAHSSGRARTM